jgi:hypothetical protein
VDSIQQAHRDLHLAVEDPIEISAWPTSPDESVFVDTRINLDFPAGASQKPRLPKRSQILALIRTHVAQRTEGQEYHFPGGFDRALAGGRGQDSLVVAWLESIGTRFLTNMRLTPAALDEPSERESD